MSSRSISISRLAYTLLNRAKARTEALLFTSRGGQKLLEQNDSMHAAQPSRDST